MAAIFTVTAVVMIPSIAVISPIAAIATVTPVTPVTPVSALVAPLISPTLLLAIPVITHEVDRPTAGVVAAAVAFPVALVFGRYPHVDRFGRHHARLLRHHHHGLLRDHHWLWKLAEVDPAINARLADLH
jgi:hypothetical protein